jgi:hypothetical protein
MRTHWQVATLGIVAASILLGIPVRGAEANVDWINRINVTVTGDTLQKTGGCNGCPDAGAISRGQIRRGDGYVEFRPGETNTFWFAGLSHGDNGTVFEDIEFAFRFNGAGHADVMESGAYQGGDTTYAAGDLFRVAIVNGRVQYFKNGQLLHTSNKMPQYPLMLDTSLGTVGTTVHDANIVTTDRRTFYDDEGGGATSQSIYLDPRQQWVDTGVWVSRGDRIAVDAFGVVRLSGDPNDTARPAGADSGRRAPGAPFRNESAGALIARIGNSDPIFVGEYRSFVAPVSGRVYLSVNDDYLADNAGEYRVNVSVQPRF